MKISKSAIFLFELMVVILVFSIAAAICTSIFAKGYQFSAESENLTRAVIKAETVAEEIKAKPQDFSTSEIFYDKNWDETSDSQKASFVMKLTTSEDGGLKSCLIDVLNNSNKNSIFLIEVAKFQPDLIGG